MHERRRRLNISLVILSILLAGWAAWICRQPSSSYASGVVTEAPAVDSASQAADSSDIITAPVTPAVTSDSIRDTAQSTTYTNDSRHPASTRFRDADIATFSDGNPFATEARKVMSGRLEETDSLSRHRILSYCEHLRSSYTTRDIDFLRQVFSDNALIIVGHTVKTGGKATAGGRDRKVSYAIRSKKEYLERLERMFLTNRTVDVRFSDFKIMRHPTMEGIYGVTLRQKYSCDRYSDDGYLFLLWDFRDPSMPLIHVRTWQPAPSILEGSDEVIEIGDFNLE
ncbi:MAG: hypothetical protein K2N48_11420 [Muribaculaceae bacterium]|nr:hypothetical protein [Muribaculaceae bacterium]